MPDISLTSDTIGSLAYLLVLLVAVSGYLFVSGANRRGLGRNMRHLLVWALIFVGVIAAYGLWQDVTRSLVPQQAVLDGGTRVEIPRSADGHYHLTLQVNGAPVSFVVDTGATDMVLSRADAARAGLDTATLVFSGRASTANGTVDTARVTLDTVTLGPVTERAVPAVVNGGALDVSLLGMRYLERWGRVSFGGDLMVLTR